MVDSKMVGIFILCFYDFHFGGQLLCIVGLLVHATNICITGTVVHYTTVKRQISISLDSSEVKQGVCRIFIMEKDATTNKLALQLQGLRRPISGNFNKGTIGYISIQSNFNGAPVYPKFLCFSL